MAGGGDWFVAAGESRRLQRRLLENCTTMTGLTRMRRRKTGRLVTATALETLRC